MEQSLDGDCNAYHRLLQLLTPALRRAIRARAQAVGLDAEDVVQEVLLALHLKRNTWIRGTPSRPGSLRLRATSWSTRIGAAGAAWRYPSTVSWTPCAVSPETTMTVRRISNVVSPALHRASARCCAQFHSKATRRGRQHCDWT